MGTTLSHAAELEGELIPAPKRALPGRGVVRRIEPIGITVRGLRLDARVALERAGLTVARRGETPAYELIVERTRSAPFSGIPATAAPEAYRCAVGARKGLIQASSAGGAWNGIATFLAAARIVRQGRVLGEVLVEDWPDMAWRGVFMEDKWGTDLMSLEEWKRVLDTLVGLKMNVLGVGLYGCWCVQYGGRVTEFLMASVPGHAELRTQGAIRWHSAMEGRAKELVYLPRMFAEDFFGQLVAYGSSRGVRVVPFVNSLGHNTLFPRSIPAISAKDEEGKPTGYGYCLSEPRTWEFVSSFYGSIIDRYLAPAGADAFHIQMDEIYPVIGADPTDPRRTVDPECRCRACRAREQGERIRDYVVKLATFLASRGMRHVIVWNDQLTRHMDLLDDSFLARLAEGGIKDRLVMHWWWYDNEEIHDKVHPRLGRGLRGWVGPMTSYFSWSYYRVSHPNIEKMLALGHEEGAEGGVSYSIYDPSNDFDFALMADGTWNRGSTAAEVFPKLARSLAGPRAAELQRALEALDRAAESRCVRIVTYYTYTYPNARQPYPRQYPLEALEALESMGAEGRSALEEMRSPADLALELLRPIEGSGGRGTVGNLLAEAARFSVLASTFGGLLEARAALQSGRPAAIAALAPTAAALRGRLAAAMATIEERKPEYLVPAVLRDLTVMHEFLTQLEADFGEAAWGSRAAGDVRWFVESGAAQRAE